MRRSLKKFGLALVMTTLASPALATSYAFDQLIGRWDCSAANTAENMWTRAYYTVAADGASTFATTINMGGDAGDMVIKMVMTGTTDVDGSSLLSEINDIEMKSVTLGETVFNTEQQDGLKAQFMAEPKSTSKILALSPTVLEYEADGLFYRCTSRDQ